MATATSYQEPNFASPQFVMEIHSFRVLRPILDRLKSIDKYIDIKVTATGFLRFCVETSDLVLQVLRRNIKIRQDLSQVSQGPEDDGTATVRVDSKMLSRIFSVDIVDAANILCCTYGSILDFQLTCARYHP